MIKKLETALSWKSLAKPTLAASVALVMLAGCGQGAVTAPGLGNTAAVPQLNASEPTVSGSGIKVYVNDVMHAANSYVLATNRNHVANNFPNGAAKLAKLKELRPRWGQGRYMYRIGHGPTDGRHDYTYMTGYHFEQHWDKDGGYPYDDIRNALKDANALDAEQLHVVNFGTGTPEEAARYVSYLNHPNDANRAKYPYPVQNAKFFEIGNEISWSKVRGHKEYASTEIKYATRAKQFAQAMRKASPVPIQIGAVASTNSNWMGEGWAQKGQGVKNILQTMGDDVDFLIYHGYPSYPMANKGGDRLSIMAQNAWNERKYKQEILPAIKQYAKKPVRLANTEFFTEIYNDATFARGMFGALYAADTVTLAMNLDMLVANQFGLDHGDMSDASFFVGNDPNAVTTIFMFQKMLAQHWGDGILRTEGVNLPTQFVKGAADSIDMPKLTYTASKGNNGKVYVMVTNRTNDSDVTTSVGLGLNPRSVTAYELKGSAGWNSDHSSASVSTKPVSLNTPYTFPKASITILEITP
ncbi:hypothetical protein D3C87_1155460 [compost metagenome]